MFYNNTRSLIFRRTCKSYEFEMHFKSKSNRLFDSQDVLSYRIRPGNYETGENIS